MGEVKTPLSILVKEFLPVEADLIEKKILTIDDLPVVKMLGELLSPVYGNDPSELIAHRFLYRAGVCLLLGPTGVGKSSLVMQFGIHLAIGRSLFGIEPGACYRGRGMRVLLIQAENDEGDLAEMRDGVLRGCTDFSDDEKRLAMERMQVVTICDRSAERLAAKGSQAA